ncbi:helix-turn-helix domain-containing protein [Portibacter marinus]|uniref:helix-turn-helix domain-containing protein n=1 Tax=Portibacter marinus TaxID=2898660 RepID=UPI001F204FB4|nr:helix-turn-helix transcriptional regulator [Portibacter marinus]
MRTVKRIIKIHEVNNFHISCLFNNGESRIIDFKELFNKWKISEKDVEFPIANSIKEFKKVKLVDGTLSWDNIKIDSTDDQGQSVLYDYQLDPIVLYENSQLDETRQIEIGLLIKQTRNELGLTQQELAAKSGTTKHYISRIENNRTGIELSTLKKIIEGGLGRRMKISIQ